MSFGPIRWGEGDAPQWINVSSRPILLDHRRTLLTFSPQPAPHTASEPHAHATGEAFRWTAEEGMVGLGNVPGCDLSSATAASWDGSVIVGRSCGSFIWTEATGMRRLADVLTELGLDVSQLNPYEVRDISWDGRVLTGWGSTPNGFTEAWIAILRDPDPVSGDTDGDGDIYIADLNAVQSLRRRRATRTKHNRRCAPV